MKGKEGMRGSPTTRFTIVLAAVTTILLVAPVEVEAAPQAPYKRYLGVPHAGTQCFTLVASEPPAGPRVASGRQALRLSWGAGDTVFVEGDLAALQPGTSLEVVRPSGTIQHPDTGSRMGLALEILGVVEIMDVNASRALARVDASCREIEVGDYLRPTTDGALPDISELPVFDPEFLVTPQEDDGTVVLGSVESVLADPSGSRRDSLLAQDTYAQGHLVTVDRGASDGWSPGHLVLFYREETPELYRTGTPQPPLVLGRGLAVRTESETSIVLITDGDFPVEIGHLARSLGPAPPPGEPAPGENRPPTLDCNAERTTLRQGESVRLTAITDDPDGDPVNVVWSATAGSLESTEGNATTWGSSGVPAGSVTVTATADDGAGGTGECTLDLELTGAPTTAEADTRELTFDCFDFPSGSATIDNRCKAVLDDVALQLRQNPRAVVTIVGHSDASGAADVNQRISLARAENARDYLVETHGVDAARITADGSGSAEPVADNETAEGRSRNRRIHVVGTVPPGVPDEAS